MARPDVSQLQSLLQSSQSVSFLLPKSPTIDSAAAALALRLVLMEVGKSVVVSCPDPMTVHYNRLVGVDAVTTQFGGRNLVISFPGQTEAVDKISYNIESGELQLVVAPKADAPVIDHTRLKFTPAAASDTIVIFGASHLSDLDLLYTNHQDLFRNHPQIVSFSIHPPAEAYARLQIHDSTASSLVELAVAVIESLNLPLPSDAATNLFIGLEESTQGFKHPHATHLTFETAAKLLKVGAHRQQPISPADFPAGSIPQAEGTAEAVQEFKDPTSSPAPSDWYAPKIYRGPMLP